jgi:hypothetical protein
MTDPIRLPAPRVPIIDTKTGFVSREWYMYFQQSYIRMGGADGPSTPDLATNLFEDAGSGEAVALLFTQGDEFGQLPPSVVLPADDDQAPPDVPWPAENDPQNEVAALRAQVAELTKTVEGALSDINQLTSRIGELLKELDAINQTIVQP